MFMAKYAYRHRFTLADPSLPYAEHEVELVLASGELVTLRTREDKPIRESRELVIVRGGYVDPAVAREAGVGARAALERAFALCRVAADFGDLSLGGGGPSKYLQDEVLEEIGVRILADAPHLMVIEESDIKTAFMGGSAHVYAPANQSLLEAALLHSSTAGPVNPRRQVAYGLFSTSHTAANPEVRLLLLVMAIEVLADDVPRTTAERAVIDSALSLVEGNAGLTPEQKNSLRGVLQHAKNQSVSATGQRLVAGMHGRLYGGTSPVALFKKAYRVRSDLVHGNMPRPEPAAVSAIAAPLELLVAHIIAGPDLVSEVLGATEV